MPMITLNQVDFYYELHGRGYPLVLVSGFGADHFFWMPILPMLSKKFQVLVFDNRAIGKTRDAHNFPLTAEIMANDVMALIQALKLEKPHVVGQSMGGTIVQSLAAQYSGAINRVGILTSSAKWRQATLMGLKNILSIRRENCSFQLLFESILSWVYGEEFLTNPHKVASLRSLFINNPHPPTLEDQERQHAALVEFDGRSQLQKIKNPTLVVSGTQDILSLPQESQFLVDHLPQAQLVTLNCGHGITGEVPEELAQVLLGFLS